MITDVPMKQSVNCFCFQECHLLFKGLIVFFNDTLVTIKIIELLLKKWITKLPAHRTRIITITAIGNTCEWSYLCYSAFRSLFISKISNSLTIKVRHVVIVDECIRGNNHVSTITHLLSCRTIRLYAEYIT